MRAGGGRRYGSCRRSRLDTVRRRHDVLRGDEHGGCRSGRRGRARGRRGGRGDPRRRASGDGRSRLPGRVRALTGRRPVEQALRSWQPPLQTCSDFPDTLNSGWRRGVAPADALSRLVCIARTVLPKPSCSARFASRRRTGSSTSTHRTVGASARSRRVSRKTRSRFGGRLEPLSHVELVLHEGRGELQTVTGASLVRSHAAVRDNARRSAVGLVAAEAVLRLFPEQERNDRVFTALTRFLDLLDEMGRRACSAPSSICSASPSS